VSEAALDGLQQAADLDVTGWDLDPSGLACVLGGVGVAVGLVVDEACHFLGTAVADIAQLLAVAVDLVGVVAEDALASVCLVVVGRPGLGSVDWPRDTLDGVLEEANHSLLLGRSRSRVDDCGCGGA
jgi:hypothetical protein